MVPLAEIRDRPTLEPGEQLTDDYGYLNISEPFKAVSEGTKRKTVYPDDLERYYKVWDKKLTKTFPLVPHLAQPLRVLIDDQKWDLIQKISLGSHAMDSIYTCYFKQ